MQRSHKIQLIPNQKAIGYFKQACGVARFVWNVALARWKEEYEAGGKPTGRSLKLWFNAIKREQYPFVLAVSKCASEQPFEFLNKAFNSFFKGTSKYPKFKSKNRSKDSFYLSNDKFYIRGKYIRVPKLGLVKMTEKLRFEGKIISATVSRTADKWFVSIVVEMPDLQQCVDENQVVGVDRGIKSLAVLSDGTVIDNPRIFKRFEGKLRRLNKELSRRTKGSSNWNKTKLKLQRLHHRIASCRLDFIHKFTTKLCRSYDIVCLEDLNVSGMLRNRKLSKHIQDVSWFEVDRQCSYKAKQVRYCDRFAASSKTCCDCDWVDEQQTLSDRTFRCGNCGKVEDRDFNAAKNIRRWASPRQPAEKKALAGRKRPAKPASMKQELNN